MSPAIKTPKKAAAAPKALAPVAAPGIDSARAEPKYFLPYQVRWIEDDSQMRLAEKSVRIGWTYCDAFKNVRKRLRHAKRDYLFSTKDQPTAVEYVQTCYKFCEIYNFTRSILSHGIEDLRVPVFRDGKDTGFTEELKVGIIKFDNGSRIIAFSSNPNALRAYGGDVGLDEFAFHPAAEDLWASASGRVTWGFDLGVWSSHNGTDTLFYSFAQEAAIGKGGWSYYKVTMADAIQQGLVEKITAVSGKEFTREQFLEDCKNRARLPDVFEQEYMCNPRGGNSAIVPWASLQVCLEDYEIEREHLEAGHVSDLFGSFRPDRQAERERLIADYLGRMFQKLFAEPGRHMLGFDVAASGQGDLAAWYIDRVKNGASQLAALFTCRTDDWHFIKTVLFTFHRKIAGLKSAGDETGLGRQICWECATQFPGVFTAVNFSSDKHDMGFSLMLRLANAEKHWPREEKDITADYFALRKTYSGKRWVFSEGSNSFNPASHCDIAWASALADKAGEGVSAMSPPVAPPRSRMLRAVREIKSRECVGV